MIEFILVIYFIKMDIATMLPFQPYRQYTTENDVFYTLWLILSSNLVYFILMAHHNLLATFQILNSYMISSSYHVGQHRQRLIHMIKKDAKCLTFQRCNDRLYYFLNPSILFKNRLYVLLLECSLLITAAVIYFVPAKEMR